MVRDANTVGVRVSIDDSAFKKVLLKFKEVIR